MGTRSQRTLPEGTGEPWRVVYEEREVTRCVTLWPLLATVQKRSAQLTLQGKMVTVMVMVRANTTDQATR